MKQEMKALVTEWFKVCLRNIHNSLQRCKLRNSEFSILSNNCVGGCVLHDLGQRFNSPTVNVAIPFPDYIILLQDFNHLCKCDFEEVTDLNNGIESLKNVPKGLLGGVVKVYFVHYKSFEEGVEAWKRRVKRIHWENLYVVLVERDGCTLEDVRAFTVLPSSTRWH